MSKAVMISIRPNWCEKIASGEKTIEVRKTKPKIDTPFKCYIYCTQNELLTKSHNNGKIYVAYKKRYKSALEKRGNLTYSGKVIGEFVCDGIYAVEVNSTLFEHKQLQKETCLSEFELAEYFAGAVGYAWHISELKIYDTPKELCEFSNRQLVWRGNNHIHIFAKAKKPPQSWCYVEEQNGGGEG